LSNIYTWIIKYRVQPQTSAFELTVELDINSYPDKSFLSTCIGQPDIIFTTFSIIKIFSVADLRYDLSHAQGNSSAEKMRILQHLPVNRPHLP
jgi:hypothetical protein